MTGELDNSVCPTCGGALSSGVATIPFVLDEDKIIVIKGVPAETCADCHEPFMIGKVTDQVVTLLNQLKMLGSEVCVVSFTEYALA